MEPVAGKTSGLISQSRSRRRRAPEACSFCRRRKVRVSPGLGRTCRTHEPVLTSSDQMQQRKTCMCQLQNICTGLHLRADQRDGAGSWSEPRHSPQDAARSLFSYRRQQISPDTSGDTPC
ncbi:hypothetical protein BJX65DRAFT_271039 [Aspergillus insuetus]